MGLRSNANNMPSRMMKDTKVSDLTVSQLQRLIRQTVQEAVAETILEISALHQMTEEELIAYETALQEQLLRSPLRQNLPNPLHDD
jgi:L-aminopeptidase/D-esterase-like protein